MTEIHPIKFKELTPIEIDTHGNKRDECKRDDNFTMKIKSPHNSADITQERKQTFIGFSRKVIKEDSTTSKDRSDANHSELQKQQGSINSQNDENSANNIPHRLSETLEPTLETEKLEHERKCLERYDKLRAIIIGKHVDSEWSNMIFHTLVAMVPGIATNIPAALIPLHNVIIYPEYWYESLIIFIPYMSWQNLSQGLLMAGYMNHALPMQTWNLFTSSLAIITYCILFHITTFWMWTEILNLQYPIPLTLYSLSLSCYCVSFLSMWLKFPLHWRKMKELRRRTMYFILLTLYPSFIFKLQVERINILLTSSQGAMQILIALLLPCIRELNIWIVSKLCVKVANGDADGANIIGKFSLSTRYTNILCVILGSSTSETITWLLIGTDFIANAIVCTRIVWIKKKKPSRIGHLIELVNELCLYQMAEFSVPAAFVFVFSLLAYGPNCNLIGNLCNGYWQFEPIKDVPMAILNMITLLLVDLLSILVTAIVLKVFCQINVLGVFKEILKEYYFVFGAILGMRMSGVSFKAQLQI